MRASSSKALAQSINISWTTVLMDSLLSTTVNSSPAQGSKVGASQRFVALYAAAVEIAIIGVRPLSGSFLIVFEPTFSFSKLPVNMKASDWPAHDALKEPSGPRSHLVPVAMQSTGFRVLNDIAHACGCDQLSRNTPK